MAKIVKNNLINQVKKDKGKQTKLTEYSSKTCKITNTSNVSEKQTISSIESLPQVYVTPPKTGSQIQARTPQSPNDLFTVNIPEGKYMSLDNIDEFLERM